MTRDLVPASPAAVLPKRPKEQLGEMYGSLRLLQLQTSDMHAKAFKDCGDAIAQIQAEITARHQARRKAVEEGGPIVDGRLRWERG